MKKELLREYNKKLGRDVVTFNLGSATDCVSKKKRLCKNHKFCYAMKAERLYPNVLPFRRRQKAYWYNTPICEIINDFKKYLSTKRNKVKYLRINESGDITAYDLTRLIFFAMNFPEITIYLYTARKDLKNLITEHERPNNLIINGSNFMIDNEFKVIFKEDLKNLNRYSKICIGDCNNCKQCMKATGSTIHALKH